MFHCIPHVVASAATINRTCWPARWRGDLAYLSMPDVVKRVRATEAQTHLQGDQRIINVAQAFALSNAAIVARVKDRRILLIDDVTATGSTLDATAAALAEARPSAIYGLALSRPNQLILVSGRSLPRTRSSPSPTSRKSCCSSSSPSSWR